MGFVEQPEGYEPGNINGCCWSCGASRRDVRADTAASSFRPERIFRIHRWLPADEVGAVEFLGMGKAGTLAICEACLTDVGRQMGMISPAEHAEAAGAAQRVRGLLEQHDRMATSLLQAKVAAREADDRLAERTEQLRLAAEQVEAFRAVARSDEDAAPALRQHIRDLQAELAAERRHAQSMQTVIDSYRGPQPISVKRGPGRPRNEQPA